MANGIIIAGFAGIGKTFLSEKYPNIIDLESSCYKYDYSEYKNIDIEKFKSIVGRKENKEWPYNYYKAIEEAKSKYDVIFVKLDNRRIEYFEKNNIEYYIVYPSLNSWEWIKQRSISRGNNEKFIKRLKEVFKKYYILSQKSKCKKMFIVNEEISLEDVLKENKFI